MGKETVIQDIPRQELKVRSGSNPVIQRQFPVAAFGGGADIEITRRKVRFPLESGHRPRFRISLVVVRFGPVPLLPYNQRA
jgi:hypothetical protein